MEHRVIGLRQVRSFDQVLSTTFSFFRILAKPLLRSLLVIAGPFLVLGGILAGLSMSTLIPIFQNPLLAENSFGLIWFGILIAGLLLCIAYLFVFTTTNSFIVLYADSGGTAPSVSNVWKFFKKLVWRVIGTGLVLMVLWILMQLVLNLLIVAAGAIGGVWLTVPMYLIVYVVIAYVSVGASLVFIIRMQEPVDIADAIKRSFLLVQDYWWQTFGVIFIMSLILGLLTYASIFPPIIFGVLQAATLKAGESSALYGVLTAVFSIFALVVFMLTSALYNIAIAVQYYSLVERKEAVGLRQRVQELENSIVPPEGAM